MVTRPTRQGSGEFPMHPILDEEPDILDKSLDRVTENLTRFKRDVERLCIQVEGLVDLADKGADLNQCPIRMGALKHALREVKNWY